MNAKLPLAWPEANQRLLAAEFAQLRRRLGDSGAPAVPSPVEAGAALPEPAAIDQITATFGLSDFERSVLLLAAGIEMDTALAALVPRLCFGFALGALDGAHWSALTPLAPLRAWRLLEMEDGGPSQSRLRIDERVLHHLAGLNQLDARLVPWLREHPAPSLMADAHRRLADALAAEIAASGIAQPLTLLAGDDADGQRDVAAAVAARLGRVLFVLAQADVPAQAGEQEALATLWQREAVLLPAALLIESSDAAGSDATALARLVARLGGPVFVAARERPPLPAAFGGRVDKPDGDGQRALWLAALGTDCTPALRSAIDAVASQFRLSAAAIARRTAPWRDAADRQPLAERLWHACCEQARPRLEELAQRIEPVADWQALVLPEAQLAILRQLAAQVRQRIRVHADWGFGAQGQRGLGISALFFGESGVGKTMACEVLAKELALDLYRIDLSSVVSKYIGETEKNLRRVFDAAEDSGAILLFDEADALFGKRSEVKDSHDRYANIEVGYLLQRMESYRGLAVLTTNQRAALDPAFLRRLRFVLQFPFPDLAQREAIWRRVFPDAMPRGALDYARLARLPMAGGHIRNIALNAAFLAAEGGEPLAMAHLARAAHHEAAKHERPLAESQTRGWAS
ncbi:ATP-binding protein [Variovorax sp. PBL-E5]|uniref:ATP-binding protein n=1 Tax=Variovorax sp. PBL-E5 TaxID=434014 RepID=UPI001318C3A5|nr:ATP-binding protein [Variovorax sp. PBL-E5]VTU35476.1 ATP-dependent zinc metalloprotease FtsH [Variovorax sp. PBL-E5]